MIFWIVQEKNSLTKSNDALNIKNETTGAFIICISQKIHFSLYTKQCVQILVLLYLWIAFISPRE